ncbi:MAG: hypothetical protein ACYCPT_14070, partial [Acidimicrobiales bacterium]
MSPSVIRLLVWLLALPHWPDRYQRLLPRPERAARVVATAAASTDLPADYAAMLDVLGPHESNWDPSAVGDHGASCGTWQTPCRETPGFVADGSVAKGWRF